MSLKISISGVRGIWENSLTKEICENFAKAFAIYLKKGTAVIGSDTRRSSPAIIKIFIKTLTDYGIDVINLNIAPTPTVGLCTKVFKASGGIVITASHNPPEWNGIKFLRADGTFLHPEQIKNIIKIYNRIKENAKPRSRAMNRAAKKGKTKKAPKPPYQVHIKKILENVDVKKIKKAKFKVALDSCNAAGSKITPLLLKALGCKVVPVYTDVNKPFPRKAEPTPEALKKLCRAVKSQKCDIGFAQDPDADRLAVVSDKGEAVSEEITLVLAADFILGKTKRKGQAIVANLSTTALLDDIAKKHFAKVIRARVGEINVVQAMKKAKALLGGEGNGGVIYPKMSVNRDSLAGIALILNFMAEKKLKISEIIKPYPKYYSLKDKIECGDAKEAQDFIEKLKNKFKGKKMDLTEGVKIIDKDWWVHVRPSNTEPIIRIVGEAKSKKTLSWLLPKLI